MNRNPFWTFPLILMLIPSCSEGAFDSYEWKNLDEKNSNNHLRWDMVDDLINNYNLEGKSIAEIDQLLGIVENECPGEKCTLYYNLGKCEGGEFDNGILEIHFKNGKVTHVVKDRL